MSFITIHSLRALPMHNLNRDQNGMPKSQFDGGIQRARLSSQSLKRPARIAFRAAIQGVNDAYPSLRTMDSRAVVEVVQRAERLAQDQSIDFDSTAAKKTAKSVIQSLAKNTSKSSDADSGDANLEPGDKKDNILLFSEAELDTLAGALVENQSGDKTSNPADFIKDFSSPSLDIAAFGRMFANRADLSTHAAVAVSHAITTHEMSLTIDYFTALDEFENEERTDAGAGHLGLGFYTSGVYYTTFTIDPAQLSRSWSGFNSSTAQVQIEALVKSLIEALPSGKLTNTNAQTKPFLVLVENQKGRNVYEFETPVRPDQNGGYKSPTIDSLVNQYDLARQYDAENYLSTLVFAPESSGRFAGAEAVDSINSVASRVATLVLGSQS